MKDTRHVIRLGHANTYSPADGEVCLSKVRACVHPLGGSVMNLRISRRAIEFDLFYKPESELHPFLTALEPIGPILTYQRLDQPPRSIDPSKIIAEARTFFNEERYWEAHETLEGLWKGAKGQEKQLLQGLILTAAALVHAQKKEPAVADTMLQDASRRLENQPAVYYGLDVQNFLRQIKKLIISKMPYFPTI